MHLGQKWQGHKKRSPRRHLCHPLEGILTQAQSPTCLSEVAPIFKSVLLPVGFSRWSKGATLVWRCASRCGAMLKSCSQNRRQVFMWRSCERQAVSGSLHPPSCKQVVFHHAYWHLPHLPRALKTFYFKFTVRSVVLINENLWCVALPVLQSRWWTTALMVSLAVPGKAPLTFQKQKRKLSKASAWIHCTNSIFFFFSFFYELASCLCWIGMFPSCLVMSFDFKVQSAGKVCTKQRA